jgi:hypothetical protein
MRRAIATAATVALGLGGLSLASAEEGDPRPIGRPESIAAVEGWTIVRVPATGDGAGYLAVVSFAGRGVPTSRVRLVARRAERADDGIEPTAAARRVVALRPARGAAALPEPAVGRPPDRRAFHLMARAGDPSSPANYERRAARLRALGARVQVYVDEADLDAVSDEALRDVVRSFDDVIWPALAARFGPAADVDGDERLTVLFSALVGRVAPRGEPVDGYTRPADLDARIEPPMGNRADLVCLHPRLASGPHLRTVLTHEYAHAIIFSRRVLDEGAGREEEGWLDEALAHLLEDELDFSRSNVDHRVRAYLAEPWAFSLVVDDYYTRGLFRSHGHRGAGYLFLRWCVAGRGPQALNALVTSSCSGVENLEASLGRSFEDLFHDWAVAQATGEADRPRVDRLALGATLEWTAAPTSCRYAWIPASTGGAVEIALEADPALRPRLTLIRLVETP